MVALVALALRSTPNRLSDSSLLGILIYPPPLLGTLGSWERMLIDLKGPQVDCQGTPKLLLWGQYGEPAAQQNIPAPWKHKIFTPLSSLSGVRMYLRPQHRKG